MLGIDNYLVQGGSSSGTRLALLRAGDTQVELLPDRGFDLGRVWFRGMQMAWTLPSGFLPAQTSSQNNDWISGFGGGLLTTCGPENFGSSSTVGDLSFPLHGSFTNLRFEFLCSEQNANSVTVRGRARYSHLFGDSWDIIRTVMLTDQNKIEVMDYLTNIGFQDQPILLLFHVNIGGDFLSEAVKIESSSTVNRYSADPPFEDVWSIFGSANSVSQETVYLHSSTRPIWAKAANERSGVSVSVSSDSLRNLFQWKFRRKDRFALGLEPATATTLGGRLNAVRQAPKVAPGEVWKHTLTLEISKV